MCVPVNSWPFTESHLYSEVIMRSENENAPHFCVEVFYSRLVAATINDLCQAIRMAAYVDVYCVLFFSPAEQDTSKADESFECTPNAEKRGTHSMCTEAGTLLPLFVLFVQKYS